MMRNKLGATWLLPPLWDSCSSTRSGRGGRRRGRTLPGWTLTRWTLSWKIKDVETYHVSSSVQSRKATSSTVSRPGIWLAGDIRTWFWQWSSWIYGRCWRWCLIGISLTNLWHINCLSMMQGRAPQMSPRSEVLHTGIFNSVSSQTSFRQNCWKSNVSLSVISLFSLVYLFLEAPNISRQKHNICEPARAFITPMLIDGFRYVPWSSHKIPLKNRFER